MKGEKRGKSNGEDSVAEKTAEAAAAPRAKMRHDQAEAAGRGQ